MMNNRKNKEKQKILSFHKPQKMRIEKKFRYKGEPKRLSNNENNLFYKFHSQNHKVKSNEKEEDRKT